MNPHPVLCASLLLIAGGGCAGSSSDASVARGGTVADYVGTYEGEFASTPSSDDPAGTRLGAASLSVASDGTVALIRREGGASSDTILSGTLSGDGTLRLRRSGDSPSLGATIVGSLARQSGSAVAALTEPTSDVVSDEISRAYRFASGPNRPLPPAPRTTTATLEVPFEVEDFSGRWALADRSASGTLALKLARHGRLTGTWTDPDRGAGAATGVLYVNSDRMSSQDPRGEARTASGRMNIRFSDGTRRSLTIRVVVPRTDVIGGSAFDVVGTAEDGSRAYFLNVRAAF